MERQLDRLNELPRLTAKHLIEQAKQLRFQAKNPKIKEKLYSLHESEVDCISKGKAHKRYEFGVKASFAVTNKESFIVGARTSPDNPYDAIPSMINQLQ